VRTDTRYACSVNKFFQQKFRLLSHVGGVLSRVGVAGGGGEVFGGKRVVECGDMSEPNLTNEHLTLSPSPQRGEGNLGRG